MLWRFFGKFNQIQNNIVLNQNNTVQSTSEVSTIVQNFPRHIQTFPSSGDDLMLWNNSLLNSLWQKKDEKQIHVVGFLNFNTNFSSVINLLCWTVSINEHKQVLITV